MSLKIPVTGQVGQEALNGALDQAAADLTPKLQMFGQEKVKAAKKKKILTPEQEAEKKLATALKKPLGSASLTCIWVSSEILNRKPYNPKP